MLSAFPQACFISSVDQRPSSSHLWTKFLPSFRSDSSSFVLCFFNVCSTITRAQRFLLKSPSILCVFQCTHLLMYFQQDNASCHKAQIISDWFLEHDNEFTLLKWPPQSPDLNPIEQLWDVEEREIHIMDVQTTNLQQLCDAIMTI